MRLVVQRGKFFRQRRIVTTKRRAKLIRLRGIYTASIFFVLTFSIASIFSTITQGERVNSPNRDLSIVSTAGKPGSSSPGGAASTKVTASTPKGVLGATSSSSTETDSGSSVIPPKPGWVSLPLFADPTNEATVYAQANPGVNGAAYFTRMGQVPVAQWFGDWNTNITADVNTYVSAAAAQGKVPVVVLYNIPNRDCGAYSSGGAATVSDYVAWAQKVANGIGNRTAVTIVEPDAMAAIDCLSSERQQDRISAISQAVSILKTHALTSVYIDSGTAVWQPASVMASRLKQANIAAADGFSLNISYFASTSASRSYGNQLSALIGNKHYVIDTSRNGANHAVGGMLCNPSWAAFGDAPTTNTGSALNDALLWIKIPWESDGQCNGNPDAGMPFWSYAIELAQNAGW